MTSVQSAPPRRMGRKQRRTVIIALAGTVLVAAVALVLVALGDRIVFFNSPSDIIADPPRPEQRIRLGGLVEPGSLVSLGEAVFEFRITDGGAVVPVSYHGLLPDLFGEGQGVITEGTLGADGLFRADTVLAKHDEAYIPAEVVEALQEQGEWRGDTEAVPAP